MNKCTNVTFKKGPRVKSKNIAFDINAEFSKLEHNNFYEYFRINEANSINHKEKYEKNSVESY